MPLWSPPSRGHSVVPLIWSPKPESLQSLKHSRPIPFVSSEVETPIGGARPPGVSTSLDTDGKRDQVRGAPPPVPCHKPAGSRRCPSPCPDRGLAARQGGNAGNDWARINSCPPSQCARARSAEQTHELKSLIRFTSACFYVTN